MFLLYLYPLFACDSRIRQCGFCSPFVKWVNIRNSVFLRVFDNDILKFLSCSPRKLSWHFVWYVSFTLLILLMLQFCLFVWKLSMSFSVWKRFWILSPLIMCSEAESLVSYASPEFTLYGLEFKFLSSIWFECVNKFSCCEFTWLWLRSRKVQIVMNHHVSVHMEESWRLGHES